MKFSFLHCIPLSLILSHNTFQTKSHHFSIRFSNLRLISDKEENKLVPLGLIWSPAEYKTSMNRICRHCTFSWKIYGIVQCNSIFPLSSRNKGRGVSLWVSFSLHRIQLILQVCKHFRWGWFWSFQSIFGWIGQNSFDRILPYVEKVWARQ